MTTATSDVTRAGTSSGSPSRSPGRHAERSEHGRGNVVDRRGAGRVAASGELPGTTSAHASPVWPTRPPGTTAAARVGRRRRSGASRHRRARSTAPCSNGRRDRAGGRPRSPSTTSARSGRPSSTAGVPSGSANVSSPAPISSSSASTALGLDDAVALASAQVQAHVTVVVAGEREGPRPAPVDTAEVEPRGQLDRDAVGQAPAAIRARRPVGTRERSRQIEPPSPFADRRTRPAGEHGVEHAGQQVGPARVLLHPERRDDDHVGVVGQGVEDRAEALVEPFVDGRRARRSSPSRRASSRSADGELGRVPEPVAGEVTGGRGRSTRSRSARGERSGRPRRASRAPAPVASSAPASGADVEARPAEDLLAGGSAPAASLAARGPRAGRHAPVGIATRFANCTPSGERAGERERAAATRRGRAPGSARRRGRAAARPRRVRGTCSAQRTR